MRKSRLLKKVYFMFFRCVIPVVLSNTIGEGFKWIKTQVSVLDVIILNWPPVSSPALGHLHVTELFMTYTVVTVDPGSKPD